MEKTAPRYYIDKKRGVITISCVIQGQGREPSQHRWIEFPLEAFKAAIK